MGIHKGSGLPRTTRNMSHLKDSIIRHVEGIKIVTDDEEIDDACTRTDQGHVDFDEKIQEETDGIIEILKEKDAAEYV
ncbi:hypothetical protein AVEN_268110-1 [Araneus ventricosus]|uniref:Uncharacterized protein n=1 Tax=Araneus ventricosus TaxID=182803 RepID=A0A4Y2X0Q8_ARAVE|nr:hypothetical protein AVEN_268110-1 [Araneus ventricosus]